MALPGVARLKIGLPVCWRQVSLFQVKRKDMVIRTIQALFQRSFVFPVCKGSDPTMRFATVNGFTNEAWSMQRNLNF